MPTVFQRPYQSPEHSIYRFFDNKPETVFHVILEL